MADNDPQKSASAQMSKQSGRDPAMDSYLASLDLSDIDVDSDMLLQDAKSDGKWVLTGVAVWLGIFSLNIFLPSTLFYQLHPLAEVAYFGLWIMLAALTMLLWRGVYALATAWPFGDELAALSRRRLMLRLPKNPDIPWDSARMLGAGILALAAVLVLLLPHEVQWQGQGYTGGWFMASLAAIATGILVGRFIIAHASIERPQREAMPPIVWPSWMRWATGAAILGCGLLILIWHNLTVQGDHTSEFSLAGASLVLGIVFAIWLARRFDELETKWQKEAQLRQQERPQHDE